MQSGFFRLCFHSSYQFGNLAPIQAHYLTAASTRKSIYINPTLQFYYTTYLSGDLIIQASENYYSLNEHFPVNLQNGLHPAIPIIKGIRPSKNQLLPKTNQSTKRTTPITILSILQVFSILIISILTLLFFINLTL